MIIAPNAVMTMYKMCALARYSCLQDRSEQYLGGIRSLVGDFKRTLSLALSDARLAEMCPPCQSLSDV